MKAGTYQTEQGNIVRLEETPLGSPGSWQLKMLVNVSGAKFPDGGVHFGPHEKNRIESLQARFDTWTKIKTKAGRGEE